MLSPVWVAFQCGTYLKATGQVTKSQSLGRLFGALDNAARRGRRGVLLFATRDVRDWRPVMAGPRLSRAALRGVPSHQGFAEAAARSIWAASVHGLDAEPATDVDAVCSRARPRNTARRCDGGPGSGAHSRTDKRGASPYHLAQLALSGAEQLDDLAQLPLPLGVGAFQDFKHIVRGLHTVLERRY